MRMPGSRSRRILLVEDDERQRAMTARLLTEQGHELVTAASSTEAMACLDRRFDLLVSDIDLGAGPDGLTLAAEARSRSPELPLLITSGRPVTSFQERRFSNALYLRKPFTPDALLEMIDSLCTG